MTGSSLAERTRADVIRVLLVEDNIDQQMLTVRALSRAGHDVSVAGSGEQALHALVVENLPVDLVLIDQGLPNMSGTELLEQIVAIPDGPGAIMVTASAAGPLVIESMRSGAIDFVAKEAGYLDVLPAVVERAHRQYDLRVRTRELQRLAILVHRSTDVAVTVNEVVTGARRLLRARAVVLQVEDEPGLLPWTIAARIGEQADLPANVLDRLGQDSAETHVEPGLLSVRLATAEGERRGLLVVARDPDRTWLPEEEVLAKTFAAYVASGLRHAQRAELEGGLIAGLQQTIRARRDFVASVSHELRTPLTSIGGYAETILTHGHQLQPEAQMDLVDRIRRHSLDLGRLIDQLIDVASLERGFGFQADVQQLDVSTVVASVLRDLAPMLADREVVADLPAALISVDIGLFQRTVTNLVSNAVKYSPKGAGMEITAEVQDDGMIRVAVRDHGIGVSAEDRQHVFEPFWRAEYAVEQAVRGTGIGLALVQEYVSGMGGTVGIADPEDGSGTVFWFTVPRAVAG